MQSSPSMGSPIATSLAVSAAIRIHRQTIIDAFNEWSKAPVKKEHDCLIYGLVDILGNNDAFRSLPASVVQTLLVTLLGNLYRAYLNSTPELQETMYEGMGEHIQTYPAMPFALLKHPKYPTAEEQFEHLRDTAEYRKLWADLAAFVPTLLDEVEAGFNDIAKGNTDNMQVLYSESTTDDDDEEGTDDVMRHYEGSSPTIH